MSALLARAAGSAPVRAVVNRGFHAWSRRRVARLAQVDPVREQAKVLAKLVATARETRFGRDHGFSSIRGVSDFRKAVPLRTYEELWQQYLRDSHPTYRDLTWPGLVPYLALTSGTTLGNTKYIPVTREMLRSNQKAAKTMVAHHLAARPDSRLFGGKLFFLGGSTDLGRPAPGVAMGDLSAIVSIEAGEWLRPYTFPPLDLALAADWDEKLTLLAERSLREPITLVSGVPSWLLVLFRRLRELSGKSTLREIWPALEVVVHGGVKFDPYRETFRDVLGDDRIRLQESYPCSEGFIAFGDPRTEHLRLVFDHGIFYEFVPVDELGSPNPTRHWLGTAEAGVNYAIVVTTCAGMWSHIVGDTVRFESLDPPLLTFTGRTKYTLSAFGEHLISEEIEGALAGAARACGAAISEWHVGPVFIPPMGHHLFLIEFERAPADPAAFRGAIDRELRARNADYDAHRAEGVGLPAPEILPVAPGGFLDWMRSRGKLGGQHKVPRMDNSGKLTAELRAELAALGRL